LAKLLELSSHQAPIEVRNRIRAIVFNFVQHTPVYTIAALCAAKAELTSRLATFVSSVIGLGDSGSTCAGSSYKLNGEVGFGQMVEDIRKGVEVADIAGVTKAAAATHRMIWWLRM
jgi:hypothetical protein